MPGRLDAPYFPYSLLLLSLGLWGQGIVLCHHCLGVGEGRHIHKQAVQQTDRQLDGKTYLQNDSQTSRQVDRTVARLTSRCTDKGMVPSIINPIPNIIIHKVLISKGTAGVCCVKVIVTAELQATICLET